VRRGEDDEQTAEEVNRRECWKRTPSHRSRLGVEHVVLEQDHDRGEDPDERGRQRNPAPCVTREARSEEAAAVAAPLELLLNIA
jgi:hypothetical protein